MSDQIMVCVNVIFLYVLVSAGLLVFAFTMVVAMGVVREQVAVFKKRKASKERAPRE